MCPGRDEARPACHLRGSGALMEQGVVDAHLCCRTSCERHIPLFFRLLYYRSKWQSVEHSGVHRHAGTGAGLADGRVRAGVALAMCGHRVGLDGGSAVDRLSHAARSSNAQP